MRKWIRIFLTLLLAVGLHAPAWANSELHPGGRLFFPLWDVSTANRETFIILTREAMREGANIQRVENQWHISGDPGKCLPRGANGSETNVNRTDLDGTAANPVFVDDVILEYYGRTCIHANERIHMSCGDVDLFLLSSTDPRPGFANVAADRRGALDVSFVTNDQIDQRQRKLENSLMGEAIISDLAEGWVAGYAAASAKAVPCPTCELIDGGTPVGYENYPMEVYLPYAFAEQFSVQGPLSNLLALWSPNLFPGGSLSSSGSDVLIKFWDGRERPFTVSRTFHALIGTLGDPIQAFQDVPASIVPTFNVSNFTCGHTAGFGTLPYENDGFPRLLRIGGGAVGCGGPDGPDPQDKSDNFEVGPRIQPSTPIAWWRFRLSRDGQPPFPLSEDPDQNYDHSGRGLVGVVLTSPSPSHKRVSIGPGLPPPTPSIPHGVADATRLWHEDPCEIAQSGKTIGPPHERDFLILDFLEAGNGSEFVALFNALNFDGEEFLCAIGRP